MAGPAYSACGVFSVHANCHAGWDDVGRCAIDRFNAHAVKEDIDTDLELLGTEYLDLIYLDDNPQAQLEPVMEAIGRRLWGDGSELSVSGIGL